MTEQTRWFSYGEPVGSGRVRAFIRTQYHTGPGKRAREPTEDRGTVAMHALELFEADDEISNNVHDDDSVCLSALSTEAEQRLLATWQHSDADADTEE